MATSNTYRDLGIDQFTGIAVYAISGGATSTATIKQGDMMQWDLVSRIATNAALASGSVFLGVCQEAQPMASLGTSTLPLTGGKLRIKSQGVHNMKSTTGETYSHLDPVFQGADVQTVSKVGATRMVGRVWLPDGSQVTGAAGTNVAIMIYGQQTLPSTLPSAGGAGTGI